MLKYILTILLMLHNGDAFLHRQVHLIKHKHNTQTIMYNNPKNASKIYKMDFSDHNDDDNEIFEPKYAFGLSEYDMSLLRIYANIVSIFTIINLLYF